MPVILRHLGVETPVIEAFFGTRQPNNESVLSHFELMAVGPSTHLSDHDEPTSDRVGSHVFEPGQRGEVGVILI